VLRLIARGLSNAQITDELVSPHTTKTHVASILQNSTCPTASKPLHWPTSRGSRGPGDTSQA